MRGDFGSLGGLDARGGWDLLGGPSARRHLDSLTGVDARIAALAGWQHGMIALWQLICIGLSRRAVTARAQAGRLHRRHRGVFAVGHSVISGKGHWMAAVLASGVGGLLACRSAAYLLDIRRTERAAIEVASAAWGGRRIDGIEAHRVANPALLDPIAVDRIPCTSGERTLIDLAAVLGRDELRSALDRAERLELVDHRRLGRLMRACGSKRGIATLRELAALPPPAELVRSEIERLLLELTAELALERPRVNAIVALENELYEVDFLWEGRSLIVETDGKESHGGWRAREDDIQRDARLTVAGYRVIRLSWRQVTAQRGETARLLRSLLQGAE